MYSIKKIESIIFQNELINSYLKNIPDFLRSKSKKEITDENQKLKRLIKIKLLKNENI